MPASFKESTDCATGPPSKPAKYSSVTIKGLFMLRSLQRSPNTFTQPGPIKFTDGFKKS